MTNLPARRVAPSELRRIFNDGDYVGRAERNELLTSVESSRPARAAASQEPGTLSQMVRYFDTSLRPVAIVHQYRKPDGTLGGSGLPDPKRLWLDGEILYC